MLNMSEQNRPTGGNIVEHLGTYRYGVAVAAKPKHEDTLRQGAGRVDFTTRIWRRPREGLARVGGLVAGWSLVGADPYLNGDPVSPTVLNASAAEATWSRC